MQSKVCVKEFVKLPCEDATEGILKAIEKRGSDSAKRFKETLDTVHGGNNNG